MRRLAAVFAAGLVWLPAARAAMPQGSAYVLTSSTRPGATPVSLTLKLVYEMQCGNPGKGPLDLTLPAAMTVPAKIETSAVLLNGKPARSVAVHGRKLVISLVQPHFVTCDVIGLGTLKVVVAKRARLGNPRRAGIYSFPVTIGTVKTAPRLRIA